MMPEDVVFEVRGSLGLITLNRPKALNSLTAGMCIAVYDQLKAWEADDTVQVIAVVGAGEKAFCAGGDVVKVTSSFKEGTTEWQDFFFNEYRMNVAIAECSKPYISFVDGITMGGGVGVSIPGDYWVASEKTLFAMPETGLGLFPDVGGGWFLPRLPGAVGMYLALTGARLKAPDLFALGLASHVVESANTEAALKALETCVVADVEALLNSFHRDPEPAPIAEFLPLIDEHFDGHSVEDIIAGLLSDAHEWCAKQADILVTKSPMSMKLSFAQLRRGEQMASFRENMAMEYALVNHIMAGHDFAEGVRAILIDKDQAPRWQPARLEDVTDEAVENHFKPLGPGEGLLDRI